MEEHGDAAVSADHQHYPRLSELLEFFLQSRPSNGRQLVVGQPVGGGQRCSDVVNNVLRQAFFPGGVVQHFGEIPHVLIVEQYGDGGRPVERPEIHLSRPLLKHSHDIGWIFGGAGEARMFKVVHACFNASANLFRPVGMAHHFQPILMSFVHLCHHFIHGHLVLVN